jgi:hypothetical protein
MGINGWMKKFLRAKNADVATDTSFSPTGIGKAKLTTLYGIQSVDTSNNTERLLTNISGTLKTLNSLIMPSCYNFKKFATGIWDYIYDTYRNNRPNRMGGCSKIR